jgi:hypothetical protein
VAAGDSSGRSDVSSIIASADRRLVRLRLYRANTRPLTKLQSLLAAVAIVTAALFFLNGAAEKWHHEGGSGSLGVDVLAWSVWVAYSLARIVLVAVLLTTIYQWFVSRRKTATKS